MTMAAAFSEIALGFSSAFGGPYVEAVIHSPGTPVMDDGGSIVTPGAPFERDCNAQVDFAGQTMRAQDGYVDGDVRILVLSDGISGSISTDDRIEVADGAFAGMWSVESVGRDTAGIGFELRGRKAV